MLQNRNAYIAVTIANLEHIERGIVAAEEQLLDSRRVQANVTGRLVIIDIDDFISSSKYSCSKTKYLLE